MSWHTGVAGVTSASKRKVDPAPKLSVAMTVPTEVAPAGRSNNVTVVPKGPNKVVSVSETERVLAKLLEVQGLLGEPPL